MWWWLVSCDSWQVEDETHLGAMEDGEISPGLGSSAQCLWDVLNIGLIFREEGAL